MREPAAMLLFADQKSDTIRVQKNGRESHDCRPPSRNKFLLSQPLPFVRHCLRWAGRWFGKTIFNMMIKLLTPATAGRIMRDRLAQRGREESSHADTFTHARAAVLPPVSVRTSVSIIAAPKEKVVLQNDKKNGRESHDCRPPSRNKFC